MMVGMDYTTRAARWLLGASAHPGGEQLTRHLLTGLDAAPGALAADVACGSGSTLVLLRAAGCRPVGVDVDPRAVARAGRRGTAVQGDAQALPLRTAAYDVVLLECALSTFADPRRALAEVARVLRPGGRLGLTDVLLDRSRADPAVVAAVDRLTAARPLADYAALAQSAGLRVTALEDRAQDARGLLRRLRRRLPWSPLLRACAAAVKEGNLGYGLLIAQQPTDATGRPPEGTGRSRSERRIR